MTLSRKAFPLLGLSLFAVFVAVLPADAQRLPDPFTVVLDNPDQVAQQGQTVSFTGTITNVSGVAQPLSGYLINYQLTYFSDAMGSLPGNFAPSLLAKLSYGVGDSYHGLLFTTPISPSAKTGLYNGGGFNFDTYIFVPGTSISSELAPALYSITVTPAPEPSQTAALGLGVLGIAGLVLKARKRSRAV